MMIDEATAIVKRAIRAQAIRLVWPEPGIIENIKAQEGAKAELATVPKLEIASHPFYPSVDEDQCGFVLAAHLTDEQMLGVPWHIATEVLDSLAACAGGVSQASDREHKRGQVLAAYGPELAELVCQAVDEAMASRREGHKRLTDWDGKKHAPLDSTELDEPLYEDCEPDAEHASATTSFDFYDAIGGARELIEQRDKAADTARYGLAA